MTTMYRREPTPNQSAHLREAVRTLAWQHARTLSDLSDDAPPTNPFDDSLDATGQRAAVLVHLAALRDVRDLVDQLIDHTVTIAGTTGAGGEAIGEVLGVTRAAVRKKYPDAIARRPGPRKAAPTAYGRVDWTATPEDGAAERDWLIRARVRLPRGARTGGAGTLHVARAGDILEMVMRGRVGNWVTTDVWQTDEPPLQALIVDAYDVEVLEVLEQVSPWFDRDLDFTPTPPHTEDVT